MLLKTYAGFYKNGRFIIPEFIRRDIPDNVRVIITVIDEDLVEFDETFTETEHTVAQQFLNSMESLRIGGFNDEDNDAIDALQNGEYRLNFEERL